MALLSVYRGNSVFFLFPRTEEECQPIRIQLSEKGILESETEIQRHPIELNGLPLRRTGPSEREPDTLTVYPLSILYPSHIFNIEETSVSAGEVIYNIIGSKDELIT
eukprot:Filipodium_phascolosomae@DN2797_c0_g1_i3.p1